MTFLVIRMNKSLMAFLVIDNEITICQ